MSAIPARQQVAPVGANVATLQGDAATTQSGSVSRTISTVYDVASQVTSMSDSDGSLTFGYDNMGRVTSDTQVITGLTPSVVLASVYNANSNRTSLGATIGSNADFKNDYLYDNLNRMTRVTQQSQSGGNSVATKRVDFAYNGLGQFTSIDRYQNTSATNIVAQTTFAYDTLNRLTDLDHKQNSTTLNAYDYTYDHIDRITSITSTAEGASTYTYDKTNQLTGADHPVAVPPTKRMVTTLTATATPPATPSAPTTALAPMELTTTPTTTKGTEHAAPKSVTAATRTTPGITAIVSLA